MTTSIIILFYFFLMCSINAFIDIDMKIISRRLISGIPFSSSMVILFSGGLYALVYLKGRRQIISACNSLHIILYNQDEEYDEEYIKIYNSYMNGKVKLKDPLLESVLRDIGVKIQNKNTTDIQ